MYRNRATSSMLTTSHKSSSICHPQNAASPSVICLQIPALTPLIFHIQPRSALHRARVRNTTFHQPKALRHRIEVLKFIVKLDGTWLTIIFLGPEYIMTLCHTRLFTHRRSAGSDWRVVCSACPSPSFGRLGLRSSYRKQNDET